MHSTCKQTKKWYEDVIILPFVAPLLHVVTEDTGHEMRGHCQKRDEVQCSCCKVLVFTELPVCAQTTCFPRGSPLLERGNALFLCLEMQVRDDDYST